MTHLKERFDIYIKKLLPAEQPFPILIAVSGGVDSIVMADLFHQHNISFGIAHCNFQLRGEESEKDELLVESYAKKLLVLFYSRRFDTQHFAKANGLSIQMAARELRYEWFGELCKEHPYDYIATAHHADDQVETMLLNFARGKSIRAMAGIPSRNQKIIRPLLFATKNEITAYAIANQLAWREDQSNQSVDYDRNFLRLQIIPLLRELNPSLEKSFSQTSVLLQEAAVFIDQEFEKWKAENFRSANEITVVSNLRKLNRHPLKSNFLYQLLVDFNFQPAVIRQVGENLSAQPGTIFLSPTHRLLFDRDTFLLAKNDETTSQDQFWIQEHQQEIKAGSSVFRFELTVPSKDIFLNTDSNTSFADAARVAYPLSLRHWQDGDTFRPLGMKLHKKLSDFFIDEKIPVMEKEKIWLLTSNGEIVWVAGLRMDDRFKVTADTKTVLKITFAA